MGASTCRSTSASRWSGTSSGSSRSRGRSGRKAPTPNEVRRSSSNGVQMEAVARAKYVRIGPRKMRRSVDMIRGRHVDDARRVLRFSQLGPNPVVLKVLDSAVANAEQRNAIPENLYVAAAWVDEGPTLKRVRPRAYGRATTIRKRTSHVTVGVK